MKPDDLQVSDVSPTTLPPAIPTEGPSHVDGEPTFEEEIARVIEGSVENVKLGVIRANIISNTFR